MGGIHASLVPDEAAQYADALFIGECEAALAAGHRRRRSAAALAQRYDGGTTGGALLQPDRRIFEKYRYEYVSAQTTRGCPMDCSFCSVTAFNGRLFRMREVDDVVAEVAAIPERDIIFVDDDLNGFSRKAKQRCLDLFRAMADARLDKQLDHAGHHQLRRRRRTAARWRGRRAAPACSSASRAPTPSRWRSSARTACRSGAGSTTTARTSRASAATASASSGSFILGIDTQNMDTIVSDILRFAEESDLDGLNPTILTPLPGTRDYARYDAEGRILFKNYPAGLGEVHARLPRHEHAARHRRRADAALRRRCCSFSGPNTSPRATGGRTKRCRPKRRGTRSCGTACGPTTACSAASSGSAPLAETYPAEMPRDVPLRPSRFQLQSRYHCARSVQDHLSTAAPSPPAS